MTPTHCMAILRVPGREAIMFVLIDLGAREAWANVAASSVVSYSPCPCIDIDVDQATAAEIERQDANSGGFRFTLRGDIAAALADKAEDILIDAAENWPIEDWQGEAGQGNTRMGYWDWAVGQREVAIAEGEHPDSSAASQDDDICECGRRPADCDYDPSDPLSEHQDKD